MPELLFPLQVGQYGGLVEEVEGLKRDKNVLMMELVHLRQQQQVCRAFTATAPTRMYL
jgi:hypothetical protein